MRHSPRVQDEDLLLDSCTLGRLSQRKGPSPPQVKLNTSHSTLRGRARETKQLLSAYERVLETGATATVLVSGSAGTGKTRLITEELLSRVNADDGFFATGKFDQIQQSVPYSALVASFNNVCDLVAESQNKEDLNRVKAALVESLGEQELEVFSNVVSKVSLLVGGSKNNDIQRREFNMGQAFIRFKQQCLLFLKSVASKDRPIVLFLDDLQWCDSKSMEVIESLMESKPLKSVLFVGSYRDDQKGHHESLAEKLNQESKVSSRTTRIELGNLDRSTVNEMVSEILKLERGETWDLSTICFSKTMGNPFFLEQFLKLLETEQLLVFSSITQSWEWDETRVQSETNVTGNILEVITERAKFTEPKVRDILRQASFLGFTFDMEVLEVVVAPDPCDNLSGETSTLNMISALEVAEKEGFIETGRDDMCKWTHDRVMQSFQQSTMAEEAEKRKLHYQIGEKLRRSDLKMTSERKFLVVDQLNLGACCMKEQGEKVRLAQMCLEVGELSLAKSAFAMGQSYFEKGVAHLPDDKWTMHYDVSLQLHCKLAEAAHSNSDVSKTVEIVDCILRNARTLEDKITAHHFHINVLVSQCHFQAAIDAAIPLLKELGVKIPSRGSLVQVVFAIKRCKRLLKGKSDEDIVNLPRMNDQLSMALQLLSTITKSTYFLHALDLFAVVSLRMLELSIEHGLCEYSPPGFAAYGLIQSAMRNFEDSYRFGALATRLMDESLSKKADSRTIGLSYGNSIHVKLPIPDLLDRQLRSYQAGLAMGDIGFCLLVGLNVGYTMFSGGLPLVETLDFLRMTRSQAAEFNELATLALYEPITMAVLHLLGDAEDSGHLSDEIAENLVFATDNPLAALAAKDFSMVTASIFQFWHKAREHSLDLMRDKNRKTTQTHFFNHLLRLFHALCAMTNYRLDGRRLDLRVFRKIKKSVQNDIKKGLGTLEPILKLIQAEEVSLQGSQEAVEDAYALASEALAQAHFISLEAVANEHAGNAIMARFSDQEAASAAYSRALAKYSAWGATAKVEQVALKIQRRREGEF